jgi:hypothetical protein
MLKPDCKAEEERFSHSELISDSEDTVPFQVSWRSHVWLRDIESGITRDEDSISRFRIEISLL